MALNQLLGGPVPKSGNEIKDWSGFAKGFKCKLEGWKKEIDSAKAPKDSKVKTVVLKTATQKEQGVMADLRNALFSMGKSKESFVNFINDRSAAGQA